MTKILDAKKFLERAAADSTSPRNSWGQLITLNKRRAAASNDRYRVHLAFDLPEEESHKYQPMKFVGTETVRNVNGLLSRVDKYEKDGPEVVVKTALKFKKSVEMDAGIAAYCDTLAASITSAVLVSEAVVRFTVDVGQFKQAVKSAMVLARESADAVYLTFFEDIQGVGVVGYSRETGSSCTLIAAQIDARPSYQQTWVYNGDYLLDGLTGFEDEKNVSITICANSALLMGDIQYGQRFAAIMAMTGYEVVKKDFTGITDAQIAQLKTHPMGWRKRKSQPFKMPASKEVEKPFVQADGIEATVMLVEVDNGKKKEKVVRMTLERKI